MIDLRQFTEVTKTQFGSADESYVLSSPKDTTRCKIALSDKDCSEVVKFLGRALKVYVSPDCEVVLGRGDRRLYVTESGRGYIGCSKLFDEFNRLFPGFIRVPMKCRWEQDGNGNKIYLMSPKGGYSKSDGAVVGRRIEDKR